MNKAPHAAVIHDLSGFGRCSMTIILPVLAAMGVQCAPMLTAYLSAHTAFPHRDQALFLDLTDQMEQVCRHWQALDVRFDAIYSGFLGSARQICRLRQVISQFRREDTLVLVDPVMGDHGRPYATYTPEMCARMAELAGEADLITPNLTEAALLLGEPYHAVPHTIQGLKDWLLRLSMDGRRSVVITGVRVEEGAIGAACFDRKDGSFAFPRAHEEPQQFPGTGDLFAAVLLGGLLQGKALDHAAQKAVDFVQQCAAHTIALGTPTLEGVQFEALMGRLTHKMTEEMEFSAP